MKQFRIILLTILSGITLFACSKKTDEPGGGGKPPAVDLNLTLKNTTWAGEFQYLAGEFTGGQPFSMLLSDDGKLTWTDHGSTRPGGTWMAKKDTIIITFPNNTSFSAIVDGDNWNNFAVSTATGIQVNQVIRSAPTDANSILNNSYLGTIGGSKIAIQFIAGQKAVYTLGTGTPITVSYTIEGAGVRLKIAQLVSSTSYFGIFQNKYTTMKNYEREVSGFPPGVTHYSWSSNKQQL